MQKKINPILTLLIAALLLWGCDALADLHDDIGFSELQNLMGNNLPLGLFSIIDQIEASVVASPATPKYLANGDLASFPATEIIDRSGINETEFSSHANGVAQRLGGIGSNSVLPNLTQIDAYEALDWLEQTLNLGSPLNPVFNTGEVANHSWVGSTEEEIGNIELLQRMDWLVAEDDYFQAVGASSVSRRLFAYAMNVVAVKNTSSTAVMSTEFLDDTYAANRVALHLVAPQSSPSNSTPVVAAAAALLQELVQPNKLTSETLKAILMAGATRATSNSQNGDIENYGEEASTNGLDYRYGAGQLNVFNSHQIVTAGAQASAEAGGGDVGVYGYDYVTSFGSLGEVRSYRFTTTEAADRLSVSLVWHLEVGSNGIVFNPAPVLYDLDVSLFDVTDGEHELIASSTSSIENTENIWTQLEAVRDYEIRVTHKHASSFTWPYALAWRQTNKILNEQTPMQIPLMPWFALCLLSYLVYFIFRRQVSRNSG